MRQGGRQGDWGCGGVLRAQLGRRIGGGWIRSEGGGEGCSLAGYGALQPEQAKRQVGAGGEGTADRGDISGAGQAQQADGEVSQAGEHLGAMAGAGSTAVLVEGHVSDPMEAVFDGPVCPEEGEELFGGCATRGAGGDAVDPFLSERFGGALFGDALDEEDLGDVGEVEVVIERGAGPDAADLEAAVALIDGFLLRGEKSWRGRAARCPGAAGSCCP